MVNIIHTFNGKRKERILLDNGKYLITDKYGNKRYLCKAPNLELIENFCFHYANVELDVDGFETAFKEFKKTNKQ